MGEGSLAIPPASSAASRLQAKHHSSQALGTAFSQPKCNACNDFNFLTGLLLPAALQILRQVTVNGACLSLSIDLSVGLFHFRTRCQQSTYLSGFLSISSCLGENTFLFRLRTAGLHVLGSCFVC